MIVGPEALNLRFRCDNYTSTFTLSDYEATRSSGGNGMTIEARDLAFSYPGTDKLVLKDINLTVTAGETLAVVGYNGSGKTTLVKALMGLYDHTGTLLINGHPAKMLDTATVHRRTSCLFQDFNQYSFTVRENVGVGNTEYMTDDERIGLALERGGAEKLKIEGLEARLNQWSRCHWSTGSIQNGAESQKGTAAKRAGKCAKIFSQAIAPHDSDHHSQGRRNTIPEGREEGERRGHPKDQSLEWWGMAKGRVVSSVHAGRRGGPSRLRASLQACQPRMALKFGIVSPQPLWTPKRNLSCSSGSTRFPDKVAGR